MDFFRLLCTFVMICFISTSHIGCLGYDVLDPAGNITIIWDVANWTSDGYTAMVTIHNFQHYQPIRAPGWTLGWTWEKQEVIWGVVGGRTTGRGDCSQFEGNIPECCEENPKIVDLMPGAEVKQQVPSCCKGGVLTTSVLDPLNSISSFQLVVGASKTTKSIIEIPSNFTFQAPAVAYSCNPPKVIPETKFIHEDKKASRHARRIWSITCQQVVFKMPMCCVSFSSFYSDFLLRCPTCSCGCESNGICISSKLPNLVTVNPSGVRCTNHMCPVRIHWHLQLNYKEYWQVKVTIINFDTRFSFPWWNLVIQHPSLDIATQVIGFNYKLLNTKTLNDSAMLWGIKFHNDLLIEDAFIQLEIQLHKHNSSLNQSWAPKGIFFYGSSCMMSTLSFDSYFPNASSDHQISMSMLLLFSLVVILYLRISSNL